MNLHFGHSFQYKAGVVLKNCQLSTLQKKNTRPQVTCSKGHAQACGEACDGKDVVKAAGGHQQGGNALLHTVTVLLEQQHGGDDHCRGHSAQHKATGKRRVTDCESELSKSKIEVGEIDSYRFCSFQFCYSVFC